MRPDHRSSINARRSHRAVLTALGSLALAACGGDSEANGMDDTATPSVARFMDGDTSVVRTDAGSEWGAPGQLVSEVTIGVLDGDPNEMFGSIRSFTVMSDGRIAVVDAQALEVRIFDAEGTWVENWGRDGEGPGELGRPDGGIAVLSDGRLVVRDPGNARFQVYSAEGEPAGQWPVIRGGFNTSSPFSMAGDTIMTPQVVNLGEAAVRDWRTGLVRVAPTGAIIDTIDVPDVDYEAPSLEASREGSTSRNSVPWSPNEEWVWHPDGFFIHGISDTYSFTLLREGSPLRIERAYEPVPVQGGEKALREATTTRNMRGTDPNWRWNGPPIPDEKPAFSDIFTGRQGRIWVRRYGAAYPIEDFDYDPSDPDDIEVTWAEDYTFDVFEADGTYLGEVAIPRDFSIYPTPTFDGDLVWAATTDDLGVQRIVRYRVAIPR